MCFSRQNVVSCTDHCPTPRRCCTSCQHCILGGWGWRRYSRSCLGFCVERWAPGSGADQRSRQNCIVCLKTWLGETHKAVVTLKQLYEHEVYYPMCLAVVSVATLKKKKKITKLLWKITKSLLLYFYKKKLLTNQRCNHYIKLQFDSSVPDKEGTSRVSFFVIFIRRVGTRSLSI